MSGTTSWDNIQFARLIDECSAAGVFHDKEVMAILRESMDLDNKGIRQIVNKATNAFEKAKRKACPPHPRGV